MTGVDERSWRRLSARMLLIHPIQELPRALPALVGVLAAGRGSGHGELWGVLGVVIPVGLGMIRWLTTRYRVTNDRVEVRQGLLRRRLLAVSRDRVRTVDVTSHALHRLLGLSRVTVGTGRSDRERGGAVRLDGLTAAESAELRDELLHRGPASWAATPQPLGAAAPQPLGAATPEPLDPAAEQELARLDARWVWYAPFTLSGAVAVGAAAGFLANASREANVDPKGFGPLRDLVDQLDGAPAVAAVAELVVLALAVVAVASTVGYVLAFWDFRLTRRPGALHVHRGLLTTRETTIEERRLHGVELSEPLLLRMVGGARCIAVATGLRVGRGAERGGSLLLPPAPRAEAERVGAGVMARDVPDRRAEIDGGEATERMAERDGGAVRAPLRPHGPRARRRRYVRALGAWAVLVGVLGAASALPWWPGWPWHVALALVVAALALAADRYRSLGHAAAGTALVTRYGSLVRRRCALDAGGIIGWNLERSFFQRRAGLATLVATTAAGRQSYEVQDVEVDEAIRLAERLLPGLLDPFLDRPAPSAVVTPSASAAG